MLKIFLSNATAFNNLGLGVLKDFITNPVITEELNSNYVLEFKYAKDGYLSEYLVEQNIIVANNQPFRIWSIKKDMQGIEIYAKHIFFDLTFNYLEDVFPQNMAAQNALAWILERTQTTNNFTVTGDCETVSSARYVNKNVVDAIYNEDNAILSRFGGELEFDNKSITVHKKRGSNANFSIRYRKNLSGLELNLDFSTCATRIYPTGFDGITIDEKYIDSPKINNYFMPLYKNYDFDIKYDPDDEDAYHTLAEAQTALRNEVQKLYASEIDVPEISIKIDFVELSKCTEYQEYSNLEMCHLGDTINVIIPELNINSSVRIVKTTYDCILERFTELELGSISPSISTSTAEVKKQVTKQTNTFIQEAQQNAKDLINHPFNGNVYIDENDGCIYLMDTTSPSTAKNVWKWSLGGLGFSSTGINGTYSVAILQDGSINADFITAGTINTNRIQGYGDLLLEVHDLNEKIQDIADITVAEESDNAKVELINVNESEPITIKIHPINESICYLYPRNGLYPSNTLYLKNRKVEFHNKTTDEYFYWEIPTNLWYYDSDNYDEISWDYETETITVNRKCKINADGTVSKLTTPTTETYDFPLGEIALTNGNYEVKILGYSSAYLYVRLMASNIYTTQFATRVEMNSSINITKENIIDTVSANYTSKTEKTQLQSQITQNATSITNEVTRATNSETNLSSRITQNADSITSEITNRTNADNNLSSRITQNAGSITSEVTNRQNADSSLSSRISQTAKGISLSVNNGSASSGITITTTKEDGTSETTTGTIEMTGIVKFTDLSTSGKTTINGANIQTGTLSASKITTGSLSASRISGGTFNGDNMTIKNLSADSITTGSINGIPYSYNSGSSNGKVSLGNSDGPIMGYNGTSKRWSIAAFTRGGRFQTFDSSENIKAYLDQDGVHNSSDIRLKENISDIDENVSINVINNLIPIEYTYKNEKTYHRGLSAQQTKETLNKNGINEEIYEINKDGYYSLNYIELIPDLINCIKYQQKEIEELKRKIGE